jgi:septum formation topological specificity factor MinE
LFVNYPSVIFSLPKNKVREVSMTIDKAEDIKRNWPRDFIKNGRNPLSWSYQAEALKAAAKAVLEQAEKDRANAITPWRWVDPVYKYLVGMALENLLKAIMVREDPCLVGKYRLSKEIKRHDIWSAYADSGQPLKFVDGTEEIIGRRLQSVLAEDGTEQVIKDLLDQDAQELLRIVEAYVVWIGRFPIATKEQDFMINLDIVKNSKLTKLSLREFDVLFEATYSKLLALAMGVNLKA